MLLDALLGGDVVSQQFMIDNGIAPSEVTARSVVSRLRKHLKAREIEIESQYGTGYWLDQPQRNKLLSEIKELLPTG